MPRTFEAAPDAVLNEVLPSIEEVLPEIRGRITRARLPLRMRVSSLPGYLIIRGLPRRLLPSRLALAGDYLVAPTVEGAVRSGLAAARRLLGR